MSFVEYSSNTFILPIKDATQQTTALIIPINVDSLLVLETTNRYKYYRIRSSQILQSGQLPKQFGAGQNIRSLTNFKQSFIYLVNNQASICKLSFKENIIETRQMIIPNKTINLNSISIDYWIMDQAGRYLLGKMQNIENKSCSLFIYDWINKIYSNTIVLGSSFFNSILSTLVQGIVLPENKPNFKFHQEKFVLLAEDSNKIHYNYISWEILQNPKENKQDSEAKVYQILLRESGKRTINTNYFPLAAHLEFPYIFVLANNEQSPSLLRINMQTNDFKTISFKVKDQPPQRSMIRNSLGIVDNNLIFSIYYFKSRSQEIFSLPLKYLLETTQATNKLEIVGLINLHKENSLSGGSSVGRVFTAIDGYSFHKYTFEHEKISKLCKKQQYDLPSQLKIEIIFRIPKKYFYSQICEQLAFPSGLTQEILQLL